MGGYNGGEIASKLAVESVRYYIQSNFANIEKDKDSIMKLIAKSIEYANKIVFERSKESKELHGMGTTLEICLIYNNKVYIGHIGDSRIYRIRKHFIRKLTQDHSYVQKLVKEGTITVEQAQHHPQKNMLMKALGCNPFVEPDVMVKGFLKDDVIIMCSDGLSNMVDQQTIFEKAKENKENSAADLVDIAIDKGGYDNITVVMIKNI